MSKDILVVYHGKCLDGFTSAWVAHSVFGDKAEYIGISHTEFNKVIDLVANKKVYFVDICLSKKEMLQIKDKCEELIVIDHHVTAFDDSGNEPWFIYCSHKSGAKMTWDYFYGETDLKSPLVEYVSDYDIYTFKLEYTRLINLILTSMEQTFDNWTKINADFSNAEKLMELVGGAKWILQHRESISNSISKSCKFITIGGVEFVVVNTPYEMANEVGDIVIQKYNKPALMWYLGNDGIKASLRSTDELEAVAFVARQNPFGSAGGGHRNAAGMLISSENIGNFFNSLKDEPTEVVAK